MERWIYAQGIYVIRPETDLSVTNLTIGQTITQTETKNFFLQLQSLRVMFMIQVFFVPINIWSSKQVKKVVPIAKILKNEQVRFY